MLLLCTHRMGYEPLQLKRTVITSFTWRLSDDIKMYMRVNFSSSSELEMEKLKCSWSSQGVLALQQQTGPAVCGPPSNTANQNAFVFTQLFFIFQLWLSFSFHENCLKFQQRPERNALPKINNWLKLQLSKEKEDWYFCWLYSLLLLLLLKLT